MRALIYTDETDQIELLVPWRDGSGNIPPPYITFMYDRPPEPRRERHFYYAGMSNEER
jgi:hypothetical protein